MADDLARHVSHRLRSQAAEITSRWMETLRQRHGPERASSLPDQAILDHTSRVLRRLADLVGGPGDAAIDGALRQDLGRLADLRRQQGALLEDVLGELGTLSTLVDDVVAEAVTTFDGSLARAEIVRVIGRVKDTTLLFGSETRHRYRAWSARRQHERMRLLEGYTAMLSHELGNRLGAAETAARLLLQESSRLPEPRQRRLNELILQSVQSGLETVQAVGTLFRGRHAGDDGAARTLPFIVVAKDAMHQMRIRASQVGVELRLTGAASDDPVDAERFPLVFYNLVTNAIRHHDRPEGRGAVVVAVAEEPGALVITVSDDGPGIPAELRERLFEPQTQGAGDGEGTGLGLAIAREAAEQMGGTIELGEGSGRGATFRFRVPRAKPA